MVLEEAPAAEPGGPSRAAQLLVLSAKSASALDTATANLDQYLAGSDAGNLPDVAYTLAVGRTRFSHRRVILCRDTAEARAALAGQATERMSSAIEEAGERPVAFMFPGQGGQYVDMGRELYETEPVFRAELDRCAELLKPHLGLDLRTVLYPAEEQRAAAAQRLEQTVLTQPAVFVMEYALARLWLSWGIRPAALAGHSLGEYAAACVAGVFSLTDALELVAARGRLMQALPPGLMLAVPLPEAEVRAMLPPGLALAVVNGPALCVVSGPIDQVEQIDRDLAAQGISARRLHISHASHSAMMDPIVAPLAGLIGKFRLQPPQMRLLSNVTGTWLSAAEATDPAYWARHLRQTVRFADNLAELGRDPALVLLEVGPGRNLSTLARQHPAWPAQRLVLPTLRHPRETSTDAAFLLNALGQLWLGGVPVDWPGFYAGQRRRRIPLPTYPFERQRYWIEPTRPAAASNQAPAETLHKRPNLADWFYVPAWKQSLPLARHTPATLAKTGPWLIFRDEAWLAERLAAALSATGRVVMVSRGEKFARLNEGVYTLDPGRPDDYAALIAELTAAGCLPRTIIHAWSVDAGEAALPEPAALEERLNLGFYSLIFLAQALGAHGGTEPLEIVVLSNDMQAVGGEPALYPDKATLLGPCKVIPQDYPHMACRSIDVDLPAAGTPAAQRLAGHLLSEIATPAAERVVAYRGGRRWLQLYEPARLPPAPEGPCRLRDHGVYLVTGGHGGISLELAEYLARAVQARLVILGRSGFPEPELWDDWLAGHDEKDSISARIRRFREWESWGARVWIVQADVADPVRMREVIDATRARFGALHGVIHAAGLGGGGIIQLKTRAMAAEVLRPKVHGTLVLDALLRDAGLDFMIYFSSLNAIAGKFGHVDYAAANAFLDAFAQYSANGRSIPTVSINWDLWDRIGMAERIKLPSMLEGWREEQFRLGITPDEGVEVFRRILALEDVPQILVSTADFAAVQAQAQAYTQSVILNALDRLQSSSGKRPRPALATAYLAPRDEVEQAIAEIWQNQLGYQPIGVDDNFFDLGGDSLLAIQMSPQVSKALNVTFSVQSLLETPTVAGVAHAIREARRSQEEARIAALLADVEQLSDENVQQLLAEQKGLEVA